MLARKKICSGCNQDQYIYKSDKRDKYCKICWFRLHPPAEIKKSTKPIVKSEKKIRPISKKKQIEDAIYRILRLEKLTENPYCELRLPGCTHEATEIHHAKGRGIWYLVKKFFRSACRSCHDWVTKNSKEAIELGLSESRLKPDE